MDLRFWREALREAERELDAATTRTALDAARCHRHARASAFTSVPSGWGLIVGAISLPSGATMRLRPPRH